MRCSHTAFVHGMRDGSVQGGRSRKHPPQPGRGALSDPDSSGKHVSKPQPSLGHSTSLPEHGVR